jgi:asparagine synthase (glutamine-hydrolysing)
VVEFSLQLPREQFLRNGVSRPLARKALSDRLPSKILDTTARGYQAADWFECIDKAELLEMIDELSSHATVREMIDLPRIHRSVVHWPSEGFHKFNVYWPLGGELPKALATGYFILEAEKWLAGRIDCHDEGRC